MNKSKILLLTGVSSSGKSTLGQHLQTLGVVELISCTTRQPRWNEVNGVTYYFVTKEEFDKIDKLENTYYSGNYYCLSKAEVERHQENLAYCIVDAAGVNQIRNSYGIENVIVINITISYFQMFKRLFFRKDSFKEIKKRIIYTIKNKEMKTNRKLADYIIQNNNLDRSKQMLRLLINKLKGDEI